MRVYVDGAIYIVKPDERRQWTISNAQSDMRRVLDDLTSGRVRDAAAELRTQPVCIQAAATIVLH